MFYDDIPGFQNFATIFSQRYLLIKVSKQNKEEIHILLFSFSSSLCQKTFTGTYLSKARTSESFGFNILIFNNAGLRELSSKTKPPYAFAPCLFPLSL